MATEPRFVKWEGKRVLEKDLPPGVRYRRPHDDTEWVALYGGLFMWADKYAVQTGADGITIKRDETPVTIISWPDDCGPRPDERPTWAEIIDNAPSPDALPVFEGDRCGRWAGAPVRSCRRTAQDPDCTFLGYFDLGGA